jgi:hypothetical protein
VTLLANGERTLLLSWRNELCMLALVLGVYLPELPSEPDIETASNLIPGGFLTDNPSCTRKGHEPSEEHSKANHI